jgi:hypothetical protein
VGEKLISPNKKLGAKKKKIVGSAVMQNQKNLKKQKPFPMSYI